MIWDRFPLGEVKNLLFNYFEDSNEEIVIAKAESTGSIVKCGERTLEEGGCGIPVRLPMNDGAMEIVEYMWHVGRYVVHASLDYVTRLQKCVSLARVA